MAHARPVVRAFAVFVATLHPNKLERVDLAKVEALVGDADGEVRAASASALAQFGQHKTRSLPSSRLYSKTSPRW